MPSIGSTASLNLWHATIIPSRLCRWCARRPPTVAPTRDRYEAHGSREWGGFKALRERWLAHLESTRLRPILLIDEAQQAQSAVLSELRLLASARFDSRALLCVVLAGDARLIHTLKSDELLPLASRIRVRLAMEYAAREDLSACLDHLLASAGNAALMTSQLKHTVCEHALGNYRILAGLGDLLTAAAQRDCPQLDEKLYLELFAPPKNASAARAARSR